MNNNELTFIDVLSIFSVLLQIMNFQADLRNASNDDLMAELQKQDREYFEKIIANQNKIITKLAELG